MKKGKTYLDLARKYFPKATDEELNHILWEYTGFPSFYKNLKELKKQLKVAQKRFGSYQCFKGLLQK